MRPILAKACCPMLLLVLAVAAGFLASHSVGATHSHSPPEWWVDLKPWGDGSITYLLCALPYELPPEWGWGVENWDAQMGDYMDFDLAGDCFDSAGTWLVWELGGECGIPGAIACHAPITYQWHSRGWWEKIRVNIYFNHDVYENLGEHNPAWEDAFQTKVSAHEWGHNLNLGDHDQDACADPPLVHLLMGRTNTRRAPCLTGPTTAELNAVVWDYGILDLDGDGFSGAVEWYVGTDQADACPDGSWDDAWPPDINNNRYVNVLDVLMFPPHLGCSVGQGCYSSRFDLTTNATINILDVLAVPPSMGMQCT